MTSRKRTDAHPSTGAKKAKISLDPVEQCMQYYESLGGTADAKKKLVRYIRAQFPNDAALEARITGAIDAQQHDFIVPDSDDDEDYVVDEEEDEEDEEDDDDDDTVTGAAGDDGADLFDLDRFKKGSGFDEAAALEAFEVWKRRRDQQRARRGPLPGVEGCPAISEDAFQSRARQMNKNMNDADRRRIADIDAELTAGNLSPRQSKTLRERRERYEKQIRGRPEA